MNGLRLTDLYPSIAGEGPRTGDPTTFVRFGGCNMRCPRWPCDTPYAIEPSIWKNDPILSPDEILERVEMLPYTHNMCITGGEPTMQPRHLLEEFATKLIYRNRSIDVFTNGSHEELPSWMYIADVSVILDWKLNGSGESQRGRDVRTRNVKRALSAKDWIKLVVTNEEDFLEAIAVWKDLRYDTPANWCVGTAWDRFTEAKLVEMVLEEGLPWRVNVQVHKFIWDPNERQI